MGRDAGLRLLVLLLACGLAHGAQGQPGGGRHRWDAVKQLPLDALIEVLPKGQAGPNLCRVSSTDDDALTCVAERSVNGIRLVFPRGTLQDVSIVEPERDRNIGRWIRIGIEVALFIDACVVAGVLGAVIAGAVVLTAEISIEENPIPRRPLHFHRRLIYRASVPASP